MAATATEFGRWLRLGRRSTAPGRGEDELPAPLMTARDGGERDEASRRLVAASPLGAISRSRVAGDANMSSNHDHRVSELARASAAVHGKTEGRRCVQNEKL